MFTATLKIDSDLYAERGLCRPGDDHDTWAQEFVRRGGRRCRITRPAAPAGQSAGHMVVSFEGSAHALSMLLEAGCRQD